MSVKKMVEEVTGGASDRVKAESYGEDSRATGSIVSNLPHPGARVLGQITLRIALTKKIARKPRYSRRLRGGEVCAEGMVTMAQFCTVLEPNTNAHKMFLLSHLLRSPWYPLVPNCWRYLHSS